MHDVSKDSEEDKKVIVYFKPSEIRALKRKQQENKFADIQQKIKINQE